MLLLTIAVASTLASMTPHPTSSHLNGHHHRHGHHGLIAHQIAILIVTSLSFILTFLSFEHISEIFKFVMNGLVLIVFILLSFRPLLHLSIQGLVSCLDGVHSYSRFF